jgi:hypothetical protein
LEESAPVLAPRYADRMLSGTAYVQNFFEDEKLWNDFVKNSPEAFAEKIREHLRTQQSPLHFSWVMPAESKVYPWLLSFLEKVDQISREDEFKLEAFRRLSVNVAILSSSDDRASSREFFDKAASFTNLLSGEKMVQVVDTGATLQKDLDAFLGRYENALVYALPDHFKFRFSRHYQIRRVRLDDISFKEAFAISTMIHFKTAAVPSIDEALLRQVPDDLPQGMVQYHSDGLTITSRARDFVREASIASYIATMA